MNSFNRKDIFERFNQINFKVRHYARGFFPIEQPNYSSAHCNRIFCVLKNPGGAKNYIESPTVHLEFRPGKLYFIPARLSSLWMLDDKLEFLSIHTSFEIIPGLEFFANCREIVEIDAPPEIPRLLELHDSYNDELFSCMEFGSLVFSLQTRMIKYYPEEEVKKISPLKKYCKVTDYLVKHGNAGTAVAELAEVYGESRESFSRNFTAATGMTPKKLIDNYVISRSLELISSGLSMTDAAEKMQFANVFTFSRFVKRMTGVSPRSWKKKNTIV